MAGAKNHDYHILPPNIWPLIGATSAVTFTSGMVLYMHDLPNHWLVLGLGVAGLIATFFSWFSTVVKEAQQGDHTPVVQLHLRYGMILFIASEVMFFVAWFWAYFDAALFPAAVYPIDVTTPSGTVEAGKEIYGMVERNTLTGGHWPPKPSEAFHGTFDPWGLPLLENNRKGLVWGLVLTVILGVLFTACQAYEYAHAGFKYAGHIYGSTFFM